MFACSCRADPVRRFRPVRRYDPAHRVCEARAASRLLPRTRECADRGAPPDGPDRRSPVCPDVHRNVLPAHPNEKRRSAEHRFEAALIAERPNGQHPYWRRTGDPIPLDCHPNDCRPRTATADDRVPRSNEAPARRSRTSRAMPSHLCPRPACQVALGPSSCSTLPDSNRRHSAVHRRSFRARPSHPNRIESACPCSYRRRDGPCAAHPPFLVLSLKGRERYR
jgi:hypothetical protein